MSRFTPDPTSIASLQHKSVVLSGGANGIGAASVKLFLERGCSVTFGDVTRATGEELVGRLCKMCPQYASRIQFVLCDVSRYEDVVFLFKSALDRFGSVDVAVSLAALTEIGNIFDPELDIETVSRRRPTTTLVDVNLLGTLYFARVALAYLRHQDPQTPPVEHGRNDRKSLILVSSVAGFKESPGLFVYQATKHAVLGLMRSMRKYPPITNSVRVNAVCPWMTLTGMVDGIRTRWREAGLPENAPEDVARIITEIAAEQTLHGEAIYIEGGRGWCVDKGIDDTEPVWLGEKNSAELNRGQVVLGDVSYMMCDETVDECLLSF
ncbi:uncharacterized protein V1516DRAFT_676747 [Lipomyces oligophaga]|uniref:uncharacterized protein n=1 Tax=Lipomyces oligophaga TaxID=45792 RepID=UPI0034CD9B11